MLDFDDRFVADGYSCFLWADEPKLKRVCFELGPLILTDALGGGNPVHGDENAKLCDRKRTRIEVACRRAFTARPSGQIQIASFDFCDRD